MLDVILATGPLHLVAAKPEPSGAYRAVTIMYRPEIGAMVWSGLLSKDAVGKAAADIESHDYEERQVSSFSSWPTLWHFFETQVDYSALIPRLRELVEERVGGLPSTASYPD